MVPLAGAAAAAAAAAVAATATASAGGAPEAGKGMGLGSARAHSLAVAGVQWAQLQLGSLSQGQQQPSPALPSAHLPAALLRLIRANTGHRRQKKHPKKQELTATGSALAASPDAVAQYLCRDPSKTGVLQGSPTVLAGPQVEQRRLHSSPGAPRHTPTQCSELCAAQPLPSDPARQRETSVPSPGRDRDRSFTTAATAAAHASAAKPSRRDVKGHSSGIRATDSSSSSSSISPEAPSPLHACLLRYGITDLAAFSAPRHLALNQEAVSSNVEPQLAELAAEGLRPKQVARLMRAQNSPLPCSYADVFLPNLQLMRQIVAYTDHRPHSKAPHLTAAGKVLATTPANAAKYLSRDPSKVQQLLQWLEGVLGVGLEQLAGCLDLCYALTISAAAVSAVCSMLKQQQVPAEQVAHILLAHPTLFGHRPETVSARLAVLQQHLGLEHAAALQVAMGQPTLINIKLESSLPPLLRFLDGYMGEEGAGCRLVRAQPSLGTLTAEAAEHSVGRLAARGYSQQRAQGMISKQPILLRLNLDSALQQQKLRWIETRAPWPFEAFLEDPRAIIASTRRLAARLALLGVCGLQPGATPGALARQSDASFMAALRQRLAAQGGELPWASWAEWEEVWLGTEEGREWGFPPLKD
ncbi:hypothetical protein N2152v2_009944 [Parachlorella kessleri]